MLSLSKAAMTLKADANWLFSKHYCPATDNATNVFDIVQKGQRPIHITEPEAKGWSILLLLCLAIGSATFLTALRICDIQTYKELMIATISGVLGVIVGRQTGK